MPRDRLPDLVSLPEVARRHVERAVRRRLHRPPPPTRSGTAGGASTVPVLLSYRLTDDTRVRMLHATVGFLEHALGGADARIVLRDASEARWAAASAERWAASPLEVHRTAAAEPLASALAAMLADARGPFLLQFDDILTVGLSGRWLAAAAALVRHQPELVVAPQWPLAVTCSAADRRITVVPFRHRRRQGRDAYRFWLGGWQRPVATEVVDGCTFGIFRNFTYGFFTNNLLADAERFAARLAWYREHVSPTSVHAMELAGFSWRGPVVPHLAIPLDGPCLLDLDYQHTGESIRRQVADRERVVEGLEQGWEVVSQPGW